MIFILTGRLLVKPAIEENVPFLYILLPYLKCFDETLSLFVGVLHDFAGRPLGQELHEASLGHQPNGSGQIEQHSCKKEME